MSLVEAGWDTEVARRPHGQHTTVVVHVDVEHRAASLHLGPLLSEDDRRYLLCDATCEVWFERHGQVIGTGRATRPISRRLRRALEHRDRTCVVPGCGATRGLHAHHIRHWEDGGLTELSNLVLLCPYHHRLHHRGVITITGPAYDLVGHRQCRSTAERRIAGPPSEPTPTRGRALSRTHRRTRRLVVVPALPSATTTDDQLAADGADRGRAHQLGVLGQHAGGVGRRQRLETGLAGLEFVRRRPARPACPCATSRRIRSPSRRNAIGPPSTASGATWPTHRPVVPPENRPSVISSTSLPRPGALDGAGDGQHLAHARSALGALVADDDDVAVR